MTETSEPLETQVDRTILSWGRTAATVAVVALLFARWARTVGPVALLATTFGLSAAILIGVLTRWRAHVRRAQYARGQAKPPVMTAAALCAVSVLFAVVGLLTLLLD